MLCVAPWCMHTIHVDTIFILRHTDPVTSVTAEVWIILDGVPRVIAHKTEYLAICCYADCVVREHGGHTMFISVIVIFIAPLKDNVPDDQQDDQTKTVCTSQHGLSTSLIFKHVMCACRHNIIIVVTAARHACNLVEEMCQELGCTARLCGCCVERNLKTVIDYLKCTN